jgi:hypothetical protein
LTVVGYHLGGVSFISAHLDWMVVVIAVLSTVPVAASAIRAMVARRVLPAATDEADCEAPQLDHRS